MPLAVAVDIGGTFTDLVAYDYDRREVTYTKAPTSYENFVDGVLQCFEKAEVDPASVAFVNHGTTLVINSLIQRKCAKAALITTKGFRDVLEIARGNRPDPFDLHYRRDEPLIARELRFEVQERVDQTGRIVTPLDVVALGVIAETLRKLEIESVAIFFMNSYANATHEKQAAEQIRRLLPGVFVTFSTELTHEWYEYERTSTVAANASVGPQVSAYIGEMDRELRQRRFPGSLFMMGSNGGLLSIARTRKQPIALVESGPIGGCIGAAAFAAALGLENVIAFDMGGTTAKCALVDRGRFAVESIYYVGGYKKGFPIRSPVVEIVEVGAGGGSIAWVDKQNRLHVGPQSAGSTPGPVCYRRGGVEPTVTDANLALGRLNPNRFLGGELSLDAQSAQSAIAAIASSLGYVGPAGVVQMAEGILSLSTVTMADAVKQVSSQHGLDPRDFALFCYGGGGPLHGCALARELSIPFVVIPPEPGNFSAIGMLLADARIDSSKTFVGPLSAEQIGAVSRLFDAIEAEAVDALLSDFGAGETYFERRLEMRYVGQRHNIKVPIGAKPDLEKTREAFDRDYKRRYGHADIGAAVEIEAVHLSAFIRRPQPDLASLPRRRDARAPTAASRRTVYFGEAGGFVDAQVFDRASLDPGFKADGPAVIEEYGSTTLVWPGDSFEIGDLREIRIRIATASNEIPRDGDETRVDPITLEVIRHGLISITNQIDANIKRTAFSPYIYEYNDFAVGLVDADGMLVAQCTGGMPPFVADSVGMAVRDGLAIHGREKLHHGDVLLCNHAAVQGQHLNNTVMYTPIFVGADRRDLIGFFAINVHWIDIGGSTPHSTDIFMEGLQLRSIKLWSKGEPNEDVYRIIENNTRMPVELLGDIAAQLSGCLLGRQLTARLVERYGVRTFRSAVRIVLGQSEAAARDFIRSLPNGVYSHETFLDNDRSSDRPLRLKVTVIVEDDTLTVDYSELADQVKGPINSGWYGGGQTTARVAFKYLLGADEMANEGIFRPVNLILPPGKILSAEPTAPMGNYSTPFPTVIDAVIKALEKALPDRVPGGHFGTHSGVRFFGRRADGSYFDSHDSGHGGWGACAHHDGAGPFRTMAHGDTRIIPLELQEAALPIRIEEFSLRRDSAGAGRFRGGLGFRKAYRLLAECQLQTNLDRTKFPPWGANGGKAARPGRFTLSRAGTDECAEMGKTKGVTLGPGDLFTVETGGGGGYGPPEQREIALIQHDIDAGYVSLEAARGDYGIDLDASGRVIKRQSGVGKVTKK